MNMKVHPPPPKKKEIIIIIMIIIIMRNLAERCFMHGVLIHEYFGGKI